MKKPQYRGNLYDIPAVEEFLTELAKQGWYPDKKSKGEPSEVLYRLEPWNGPTGRPEPAQAALYEEMGWEYVCDWVRPFRVFRSIRPDAVELHTDPVTESWNYKPLLRSMAVKCVILLLLAGLLLVGMTLALHRMATASVPQKMLHQVTPFDWVFYLAVVPVLLSGMVEEVRSLRLMHRLYQLLRTGQRPTRALLPPPKTRPRWLRALSAVGMALHLLWGCGYRLLSHYHQEKNLELEEWGKPAPVVDLAALESAYLPQAGEFYAYIEERAWSPAVPEQLSVAHYRQRSPGLYNFDLLLEYYRTRSSASAQRLLEGFAEQYALPYEEVSLPGYDRALYFPDDGRADERYDRRYFLGQTGQIFVSYLSV